MPADSAAAQRHAVGGGHHDALPHAGEPHLQARPGVTQVDAHRGRLRGLSRAPVHRRCGGSPAVHGVTMHGRSAPDLRRQAAGRCGVIRGSAGRVRGQHRVPAIPHPRVVSHPRAHRVRPGAASCPVPGRDPQAVPAVRVPASPSRCGHCHSSHVRHSAVAAHDSAAVAAGAAEVAAGGDAAAAACDAAVRSRGCGCGGGRPGPGWTPRRSHRSTGTTWLRGAAVLPGCRRRGAVAFSAGHPRLRRLPKRRRQWQPSLHQRWHRQLPWIPASRWLAWSWLTIRRRQRRRRRRCTVARRRFVWRPLACVHGAIWLGQCHAGLPMRCDGGGGGGVSRL